MRQAEADPLVGAFGYMLNCGPPEDYTKMLAEMAQETDKPIGAYPNLYIKEKGYMFPNPEGIVPGEKEPPLDEFEEQQTEIAACKNVRFLGGCCGVYPKHIGRIAKIAANMQD